MKKKLVFIGMVFIALVLTSGTFAYTYTNEAASTLNAAMTDAPFTTYTTAPDQPNWNSILPAGQYQSAILVPVAAGDYTSIYAQYPATGEHWDKVDEEPADELTTYITTLGSSAWMGDAFEITDFTGSADATINSVIIYIRFAANATNYTARAIPELVINGTTYSGPTATTTSTTFTTVFWQNDINPDTGLDWTRDDINALQAGVSLKGPNNARPSICTQVYVQVDYEFTSTQGEVPQGNLYTITPHQDYTGDLLVKVYLTNTAELLKAYQYINMKVYVNNSLEAAGTPNYKILSIETGVIEFNIIGGSASSYLVSVTGGSYSLISNDSSSWGAGWSITPEFYCEVTQR